MLGFNYTDFQSGAIRGFKFANNGCCRNEYRQGVLNAAQTRIFEQDLNKDGVLTLDEFINADNYATQKQDAMNCQSSAQLAGNYGDYVKSQAINQEGQIKAFQALDVNRDGVLDQRELANEISLMDALGDKNGSRDGVVSQRGYESLWCDPNKTPEQQAAMLRENYRNFNAANLGMAYDKYGEEYSRKCGSTFQNCYGQIKNPIYYPKNPLYNAWLSNRQFLNAGYLQGYPQNEIGQYQNQAYINRSLA
ncbi:hypothetical protein IJS77_00445, partial [bacterium]|nr:hypothetical protein [bacterium]